MSLTSSLPRRAKRLSPQAPKRTTARLAGAQVFRSAVMPAFGEENDRVTYSVVLWPGSQTLLLAEIEIVSGHYFVGVTVGGVVEGVAARSPLHVHRRALSNLHRTYGPALEGFALTTARTAAAMVNGLEFEIPAELPAPQVVVRP